MCLLCMCSYMWVCLFGMCVFMHGCMDAYICVYRCVSFGIHVFMCEYVYVCYLCVN